MASQIEKRSADRLVIHNLARHDGGGETSMSGSFAADVRAGLTAQPKQLFPKYFYDEVGSRLFDVICLLPEYYLTRAESEILTTHADDIVSKVCAAGETIVLVEMGSGSAQKTRLLIEALLRQQGELLYTPVDISASALEGSARLLLNHYSALQVIAYAGDYERALASMRASKSAHGRKLVLFLGSNIGNFDDDEARRFLRSLRSTLDAGDALLVGADLKKDAATLEAAYDDELGVTAAFNLNVLMRINRELGANFDLRQFAHVAVYNEIAGRVEIYIESKAIQSVQIEKLNVEIHFALGERIHTENSYKYDVRQLATLAGSAGFALGDAWFDRAERFSSNLFVAA
ncbi:MAG: L-histidine N(alpha)-methyltransferase [Pyrinomonadaceae bacterium]